MSFRPHKFSSWLFLAAATCLGLGNHAALAQGTHQPKRFIELSETNSAEILTNLNRLTTKQDGLNQLEDQLGTLNSLTKNRSLQDRMQMPYVPRSSTPISSKTLKDLLDRKQNWGLSSEDLNAAGVNTGSDPFSTYENQKLDGKSSSLQQFYDALNSGTRRQGGFRAPDLQASGEDPKSSGRKSESSFDDSSGLPPSLREKADKLKESVNEDPNSIFSPAKRRSSFENFFGLNRPNPAAEATQGQKTSMQSFVDQFKQVLEGPSKADASDPVLKGLLPETAARQASSIPSMEKFQYRHSREETENSTPGTVSLVPNATIVPDLNSAVLNRWNPMYTPPKLEIPKIAPPTPPNLDFPRRRF